MDRASGFSEVLNLQLDSSSSVFSNSISLVTHPFISSFVNRIYKNFLIHCLIVGDLKRYISDNK